MTTTETVKTLIRRLNICYQMEKRDDPLTYSFGILQNMANMKKMKLAYVTNLHRE